jgi:PleD family two-component response regulator
MNDTVAKVEGIPLVLLINDEEWTTRSIESILKPEGYAVLRAFTGKQGLELAARIRPDLILIDFRLPDITGIDLCARLRELPTVRPSTPILIFTSGALRRQDELDGFRAGAWGMLAPPFNSEELVARLGPLVAAKRDADAALESSFLDPLTGFYNIQGLMRRVTEVAADTSRSGRPLTCVVLGPKGPVSLGETGDALGTSDIDETTARAIARDLSTVLVSATRASDSIGRIGRSDFVILAPGADRPGAEKLAERLLQRVDAGLRLEDASFELSAGFYSVASDEPVAVIPEEVLRRATLALRRAQAPEGVDRIRAFQAN